MHLVFTTFFHLFPQSVNDVYELENLPFLDGVIAVHRKDNTITMLPGDFVAPSLLSSLDNGKGMVDMLNRKPSGPPCKWTRCSCRGSLL